VPPQLILYTGDPGSLTLEGRIAMRPLHPGSLLSKLADAPSGPRGTALSHHEFDIETKNTFSLAPLGERGDRKAGGEGVFTKMEFVWESRKSQAKVKWPQSRQHFSRPQSF
jgi:hypothetical protein